MSYIRSNCGPCANVLCSQHGCIKLRTHHMAIIPAIPQGCVCPPTSEQTCQNPLCPRKGYSSALRGGTTEERT